MKLKEIELCLGVLIILIVVFMGVIRAVPAHKKELLTPVASIVATSTPLVFVQKVANTEIPQISFGSTTIDLLLAKTEGEREKGLGGLAALHPNQGMLFVFETPDLYPFWMKDMRFAIDIIWLDEKCTVVHLEKNVEPDTSPLQPKIYSPRKLSVYVLEVNAGFSDKHNITVGTRCKLLARL